MLKLFRNSSMEPSPIVSFATTIPLSIFLYKQILKYSSGHMGGARKNRSRSKPAKHPALQDSSKTPAILNTTSTDPDRSVIHFVCSSLLFFPLPLVTEACSGRPYGRTDVACPLINFGSTMFPREPVKIGTFGPFLE